MSGRHAPESADKCLVIRPNASLTPHWAYVFMGFMCAVSFGIAGLLAVLGYWIVLPIALLEMLALAVGLAYSLRNNSYREIVSLCGEQLQIEVGHRWPERRWQFQRAWAQVQLEPGPNRTSPNRLLVMSHGSGCELGGCLTDEERIEIARQLRRWLRAPAMTQEPGGN